MPGIKDEQKVEKFMFFGMDGLSVNSKHDSVKHTEPDSIEIGGRMKHGPRKNPFTFGAESQFLFR